MKKKLQDLFSGLATGLFSIPEGMAYAKLAGVNPVFGLYSGIIPTITASMSTSTVLMISTLTSAIALSTKSVLDIAGVHSPSALITLTFLIGCIMLILGMLRLGNMVNFVSNSVMTGFIAGASFLILVGELGDLVGIELEGENKWSKLIFFFSHISHWEPVTSVVGFGTILLMLLLRYIPKIQEAAAILSLFLGTIAVHVFNLTSVSLVKSIAEIPSSLPPFGLPDPDLMPSLALGALSVAMVALTQGAGISTAIPNPDGSRSRLSRDFIGEGLGNILGSFFHSMGTGGSLSRTAISVGAGAKTRLGGIFAGLWLGLIVWSFGKMAEQVPLSVIAGMLIVVAGRLIYARLPDIRLVLKTSLESTLCMLLTFFLALFIPLQWTIFLGAGLSFIFYIYTSATEIKLYQLVKNEKGYFEERKLPAKFPSNEVTIVEFTGNHFFAEVPVVKSKMPSIRALQGAAIIFRMRGQENASSTFLKWLRTFTKKLHATGNLFVLEGVEPNLMQTLEHTGIIDLVGKENIFEAKPGIEEALDEALRLTKTSMKHII